MARCSVDLLSPSPPAEKATARQDQGPEVVVRSVRASSISAIAIMTNVVGTNRILGSPPSSCVTPSCLPNCFGGLFLPICIESARIRHHDDTDSIRNQNRCV